MDYLQVIRLYSKIICMAKNGSFKFTRRCQILTARRGCGGLDASIEFKISNFFHIKPLQNKVY